MPPVAQETPETPSEVCCGCLQPADRFCRCCPLQLAGYATGLLALIAAFLNVLRLMTKASQPSLTNPSTVGGFRPSLLHVAIIDIPYILLQVAIAHFAWKAASALDLTAAKRATTLTKVWFFANLAVSIFSLFVVTIAFNPVGKGSAVTPEARAHQEEMVQIMLLTLFGLLAMLILGILTSCLYIGLIYYYMWSLTVHLAKGNRSLILLGHNDPSLLPGNGGQPPGFVFHSMSPVTNGTPSFVSNDAPENSV